MKKKEIEFIPKTLEAEMLVEKPVPASKAVPEWYKNAERYVGGNKIFNEENGKLSNLGMKGCIPFLDTFLTGYIQKTWSEIKIESGNGQVKYSHATSPVAIGSRNLETQLPIPNEYHNVEFLWKMQWLAKVPKGYSVIYTHPFNRFDLPFHTLTGIIDADELYYENAANHPFLLKKDFSGIIPIGTPIVMMIPFKRDSWVSSFREYNEKKQMLQFLPRKMYEGYYKKYMWSKKDFS